MAFPSRSDSGLKQLAGGNQWFKFPVAPPPRERPPCHNHKTGNLYITYNKSPLPHRRSLIQYYILAVLAPYVTFVRSSRVVINNKHMSLRIHLQFTPHDPRDLIHAAMMRDKLFGFCTANVCWRSLHDVEPVVVVVGDGEPDVDPEVEEDPELEVEPELEVLETNEATGGPGKMY
jgi:hypothetical protein